MTFCQHNYKQFYINGYTIKQWCTMVNVNQSYCKNFTWWKWVVFYFWVFVGRVNYIDLPSFHPYWGVQVKKDIKKRMLQTIAKYNECVQKPEMIKYHFNGTTTLKDIQNKIYAYKKELKN